MLPLRDSARVIRGVTIRQGRETATMSEPLCICCYDPVTAEDGDPLYTQASADMSGAQAVAWVHKHCLAEYAKPFEIGDFPESDLAALREYAARYVKQ
jgi:hypothetical protein